jgi:Predicted transcriptional regulator
MSKIGFIQRYLFIIRIIKRFPYISLQEIISKVEDECAKHDIIDIGISMRTIQRDLQDIKNCLGISIEYSRTKKGYYIPKDEEQISDLEQVLEPFNILNALTADSGLPNFVFPEKICPSGSKHLFGFIHAIKNNCVVQFSYQPFQAEVPRTKKVEPYALKEFRRRWYLLGKYSGKSDLRAFGLDRIDDLDILTNKFKKDPSIDIETYFNDSFGIFSDHTYPVEELILSFDNTTGKYLQSMPLHHSQRIIKTTDSETFIELKIRVTPDFLMEILSRSQTLRVISPDTLKTRIRDIYLKGAEANK